VAHGQIAALHETGQATLDGPALNQDVSAAVAASQADVGAESIDQPLPAATRMGSPEVDEVAEPELDDFGLIRTH
jgi:hypothetical protein